MISLAVTRTTPPIDRPRRRGGAGERRRCGGHRFGVRDKRVRGCGGAEAARRAREQRRPERFFERVDMAPDSRLREAQPSRGAAEAQVARDFEKGAQFVPVGFAAHTEMYS
jgi:hypothetical protein